MTPVNEELSFMYSISLTAKRFTQFLCVSLLLTKSHWVSGNIQRTCSSDSCSSVDMATRTEPKGRKPKMIVFDLDYTLWPFWVDTHVDPPFQKRKSGDVVDRNGRPVKPYREVPDVLKKLKSEGYLIAVASRTSCTKEANSLIALFNWDQYFCQKEIYPGCKLTHFNKFSAQQGIAFKDMLFFDDEYRNIQDLSKVGVTCYYIDESIGVTEAVIKEGLQQYSDGILKES
ncbi:Magnesium-dependent phosphatase 1 [Mactra antiquata]